MSKKSELLLDDGELLVVQTKLAIIVGDRQAVALQQIHYWLDLNAKADKETHFFDGCWWAYNTWAEWRAKNFPFWSKRTIQRIFDDLNAEALILVRPHEGHDKGNWVTINYGELQTKLESFNAGLKVRRPIRRIAKGGQNDHPNRRARVDKLSRGGGQNGYSTGNTENNTETKTSRKRSGAGFSERPNIFQLFENSFGQTITAGLRDMLLDAQDTYPTDWIEDAFKEAVSNGVRRWSYVKVILERWQRDGKGSEREKTGSVLDGIKVL